MALFDPWALSQPGGGLFGGRGDQMTDEDIAALIRAYSGSRKAAMPQADAPQVEYGDPNATPLGPQVDPYGRGSPLMPQQSMFDTTRGGMSALPTQSAPFFPPQAAAAPPAAGPSAAAPPAAALAELPPGIRPTNFFNSIPGPPQQQGPGPQQAALPPLPERAVPPRPEPPAPPAAAPAAAVPPQAYAQQQPAERPPLTPMDRLGAFSANLDSGGNPLSAIINAATGAATGQRMDDRSIAMESRAQMQRAVFGALLKQGDRTPQEAYGMSVAIANNPQAAAPLLQQLFGHKYTVHMKKDALGGETPMVFDANSGTFKNPPAGGGVAPTPGSIPENYDDTGRDVGFLNSLEPTVRQAVLAVDRGDIPAARNLQAIMPLATRYNRNFTGALDWEKRRATVKNYDAGGSGEGSRGLRAAGTTIAHGMQLVDTIKGLNNSDTLPSVTNRIRQTLGSQNDPKMQEAIKNYEVNKELYIKELDVALTGKSTVSGAEELRHLFDKYESQAGQMAAVKKTLEMLHERIAQHAHTYNQGMNTSRSPLEMLPKKDATNLERLLAGVGGGGHGGSGALPPVPQGFRPLQ